ncbi:MAG: sulfatase-like hydrolase/transferase [Akkermansiaceae bacterium]|nr:sulfatase-like hydrolase/transferase [Akkermansiaceae bacterium]
MRLRTIVSAVWFGLGLAASAGAAERPNIVFIFSDDHALSGISAYGGIYKDVAPTPNIDRLAAQGVIFERSYCANSICGPSRACILTGKHSHVNGFVDNEQCTFDGSQPTFPKYLQQAGYQTAMIGKWHLISNPTGFDHWDILPGQGNYYNPNFLQMDGSSKRLKGYCTDLITDKALTWLKEQRTPDKPFVLMCQHKAPHRNWVPAPRHYEIFKDLTMPEPATLFDDYSGRSKLLAGQEMSIARNFYWGHDTLLHGKPTDPRFDDMANGEYARMDDGQKAAFDAAYGEENRQLIADLAAGKLDDKALTRWKYQRYVKDYLGCVRGVDESVGRLLDYLDESGLAKNTIVVYSSDQGFYLGEHGWYDKRWMFEESLSMPLLVRWPGVAEPGVRSKALVQNIDYAPTFLAAAGLPVPEDIQGRSLLPLLKGAGTAPADWREGIYYAYYGEQTHHVPMHDGVRSDRYKLMYMFPTGEWQLFDMEKDPQEMHSVHADPAYRPVLEEMQALYRKLRAEYRVDNSIIPVRRSSDDWWEQRFSQKAKQAKQAKDCQLVFIGDSITQAWENAGKAQWNENFATYHPLNLGFSGDRTEHVLFRLKNGGLNRLKPKVAVLLIGTNNTGAFMRPAAETAGGIKAILDDLRSRWPETKIVMLSILPRGPDANDPKRKLNDDINTRIAAYADGQSIHLLDLADGYLHADGTLPRELMPDLLHLSPKGYQIWVDGLLPKLKELGL